MDTNLEIWNKVSKPEPWAMKEIKAGRLKGKTDINPQWRYKVMTELFGPIGIGWKYTIGDRWTEPGANNETMCFQEVSVYIKQDGAWSEPIPGLGGSTLVAKESSSMHNNDEGFKMALTDALSVALKMLGVGADIYQGLWDGSKWQDTEGKGDGKKQTDPTPLEQAIRAAKQKIAKAVLAKGYEATEIVQILGDSLELLNKAADANKVNAALKTCLERVEKVQPKAATDLKAKLTATKSEPQPESV